MFNVAHHGGQAALCLTCNALAHFGGRQTVVVPDDADDRDVDLWEYVCRHILQRKWGSQKNQDRHDDESVGALERQLNHGHRATDPF